MIWALEFVGGCPLEDDVLGCSCFLVSEEGCFEIEDLRPHYLVRHRRLVLVPPQDEVKCRLGWLIWANLELHGCHRPSLQAFENLVIHGDEYPKWSRIGCYVVAPLCGIFVQERDLMMPLIPRERPFGAYRCGLPLDTLSTMLDVTHVASHIFEIRDELHIIGRANVCVMLQEGLTGGSVERYHLRVLFGDNAPQGSYLLLSMVNSAKVWIHWSRALPSKPYRKEVWIPHPCDGFPLPNPFRSSREDSLLTPTFQKRVQEQLSNYDNPRAQRTGITAFLSLVTICPPGFLTLNRLLMERNRLDYVHLKCQVIVAQPAASTFGASFHCADRDETVRVRLLWKNGRYSAHVRRSLDRILDWPSLLVFTLVQRSETVECAHWSRTLTFRHADKWIPRDGFAYPLSRNIIDQLRDSSSAPKLYQVLDELAQISPCAEDHIIISLVYDEACE